MAEGTTLSAVIDTRSMKIMVDGISEIIGQLKNDIRTLNTTTSNGLGNVNSGLSSVSGGISALNRDLMAQMVIELERLTSVKNEITRTIEVDAQTNILEHISNLSEDISLIHTAFQRIKKEHTKTFTRLAKINNKFDTANEQVKDSYVKDITRLGKYIFEVWELHYLKTIYLRLKSQHIELFNNSTATIDKIKSKREEILTNLLKAVDVKIAEFESNRAAFDFAVQNIKSDSFRFSGPIELPVTILESDNDKVFFNCDIYSGTKDNDRVKVQLTQRTNVDMSKMASRVTWRNMSENEISNMENNLNECAKQGFISEEYMKFLIVSLKNNPPLTIESAKK
jgi:hypothetical protein